MRKENHFSEKVLKKIKEKKITPKPKWQFLLKDYLVWVLGGLALLVGGLAFSVIIYMFIYNDWNIYAQVSGSLFEFVLLTLPYFWIVVLALFILAVNYNLRHTKKGYRYPVASITAATIVISMMLGVLFFGAGMGQALDYAIGKRLPLYDKVFNRRMAFWGQPGEGRIGGLISGITSETGFTLVAPDKKIWEVDASQASIPQMLELVIGMPIKLLGENISSSTFRADEILPPGPGRGFFERPLHDFPEMFEMMEEMHDTGMMPRFRPQGMMSGRFELFQEYPELRAGFEEKLLENKELYQESIERDPQFIEYLKALGVNSDVIEALTGGGE